jgi:HD-GYP domain-containing protein (c-di-GMP phosphodiesterase class II)
MGSMTTQAAVEIHPGELFAALSLALDLGTGHPAEHALRTCLMGLELADRAGLDDEERADVYHLALLHSIGCTADSPETARRYGDDVFVRYAYADVDASRPPEILAFMWRSSGPGEAPWSRVRRFAGAVAAGADGAREGLRAHCEVAQRLAGMLSVGEGVENALWFVFERFDGKGFPRGVPGDEIPRAARILHIARDADVIGERFQELLARRSGGAYDPDLAELASADLPGLFAAGACESAWDAVAAARPARTPLRGGALDEACRAVAYFADLKSGYTLEHSTGVAELAEAAGWRLGLPESEVGGLRRGGLVHDLGRVGVPTRIWDKPGRLSEPEWERVRLHPYYTQRSFARAPGLAALAQVAAMHHERADGSGYPAGAPGEAIPLAGRLLAAADAYHAMTESRAHRPAHSPGGAAEELEREARLGRLDPEAVDAVLAAAGQQREPRVREWPAGLTDREVDVLRLIARGRTNREAAAELGLSPKTVGHHVQHLYSKVGCSTRAAAALFAMEQRLL